MEMVTEAGSQSSDFELEAHCESVTAWDVPLCVIWLKNGPHSRLSNHNYRQKDMTN